MFSKSALFVAASSVVVASSDTNFARVSVFRATSGAGTGAACTNNGAPVNSLDLTVGGCTPVLTATGATVYAQLGNCTVDNGEWGVTIFQDSICNGTVLTVTSGSDACDCGTGMLGPAPIGIRASCGATQNNCFWFQQYDGEVCTDSSTATSGAEGYYISGETCVETNSQAMTVTCDGGSSTSPWSADILQIPLPKQEAHSRVLSSSCSASTTATVNASSCDACVSAYGDDFYAESSDTFKINCGGFNPTIKYMCDTDAAPTFAPSASPTAQDDSYSDDADDSYGIMDDDDDAASAIASGAAFLTGSLAAFSAVYLM